MVSLIGDIRKFPGLFGIGGLGIIASFALLFSSIGTNDIQTWEGFAREIQTNGLISLYQTQAHFNHPPLMGVLASFSLSLSLMCGLPFATVFKLFPVLANIAAAVTLWAIWKDRSDSRKGAQAFAMFCWALSPMFVAAYHGNTDCIMAFLCLLSLYFLEVRRNSFLGGLALAAAINVKIVPVLIVLPMLAGFQSFKEARSFAIGVATSVIPFVIALISAGTIFAKNVLGYGSSFEMWGIQMVIESFRTVPGITPETLTKVHLWYFNHGTDILLCAIILITMYGSWRKLGHANLMAAGLTLFLVLAPGFGVQYVANPVALMFAVTLAGGMQFAVVAGIFVALVYASWSVPVFPLFSYYQGYDPSLACMGFATWLLALGFLRDCLLDGPREIPAGQKILDRSG